MRQGASSERVAAASLSAARMHGGLQHGWMHISTGAHSPCAPPQRWPIGAEGGGGASGGGRGGGGSWGGGSGDELGGGEAGGARGGGQGKPADAVSIRE